jgi:hypothetical protein
MFYFKISITPQLYIVTYISVYEKQWSSTVKTYILASSVIDAEKKAKAMEVHQNINTILHNGKPLTKDILSISDKKIYDLTDNEIDMIRNYTYNITGVIITMVAFQLVTHLGIIINNDATINGIRNNIKYSTIPFKVRLEANT